MQGTVIRARASDQMALIRHPDGGCSVVEWGEDSRLRKGDRIELSAEDASYCSALLCDTGQRIRVYCHLFKASTEDAHSFGGWVPRE